MSDESKKLTVYEYLRECALSKPTHLLMADEADSYTCSDIYGRVNRTACGLNHIGIVQGSRVVLRTERNTASAVMLLSLMAVGAEIILVDENITVLDYFRYKEFENTQGYITHENNDCWVRVAFVDSDRDIIPSEGAFEACTQKDMAATQAVSLRCADKKWMVLSQRDIIDMVCGMSLLDDMLYCRNLCIASIAGMVGLLSVIGSIIKGYSVMFPKLFGARHLLYCISCYDVDFVSAGKEDYLALTEYVHEYDTDRLKFGITDDIVSDNHLDNIIEKILNINLVRIGRYAEGSF